MAKTETTPTVVQMDDGRTVEFTGKTRMIKTATEENGRLALRIDYLNGETRTFVLPAAMVNKFALHGASQKYGDEASGVADLEDAIEAIDQLDTRIQAGEWTVAREGGSGMAGASVLAKALVKVTGRTIEVVRNYLAQQDNKVKAALRIEPNVAAAIKAIEAEKAERAAARGKPVATVDAAAKLAEILGA